MAEIKPVPSDDEKHEISVGDGKIDASTQDLIYDEVDEEPEIHARTYLALASMFLLNMVQVVALQGPPAVLTYIGEDLNAAKTQTWVPNSLSLVQAVIGPVIASASDTFQARKTILVATSVVAFIGAAVAPGSQSIYRLIVAQILIGFGFASVPLAYSIPSEVLPRRWRPVAQGFMNLAASLGAILSPLTIGALVRSDIQNGWRKFYWFQMALWGATAIGIFFGYRPPKRHTRYDHLSFFHKIKALDLIGFFLLTAGLTLFLTGMNLGGGLYAWSDVEVLATLIIGVVVLISFGVYETKFISHGIMHHELFQGGKERGRTFALCVALIFIEGILLFANLIWYPVLTTTIFEHDPFLSVARGQPFWVAAGLSTLAYGYASTKLKTIRSPMFIGYVLLTAGMIGLATIQPDDSTSAVVFNGLAGLGFGGPLVIIVAGVHLSTPHHLIATATAVTTSARAVAATVFTASYSAAFTNRLAVYLPQYISRAALGAGLPKSSLPAFIGALSENDQAALASIPGLTPAITYIGVKALKQAFADSLRVVFIIAAPFGVVACVMCFFLGDMSKTMNYMVEAPVEALHHKRKDEIKA